MDGCAGWSEVEGAVEGAVRGVAVFWAPRRAFAGAGADSAIGATAGAWASRSAEAGLFSKAARAPESPRAAAGFGAD